MLHSRVNASQGAGMEVRVFAEAAARPRFYGGFAPKPPFVIFGLLLRLPLQAAVTC